jgi:BirA family biotin operon repressor/biotin-[acetyl-CoA-carboxylase] ligase
MFTPRETWHFDTERIGRRVLVYDRIDSTNTHAAALAGGGHETDGLALVAYDQSAGRGQYGRTWHSRPGSSLLMSVVLHPPPDLRRPVVLTAWAAVSVARAVLELTAVEAQIKWPNDLLIGGRKVCGILIEQSGTTAGAATAVVGIGLNLNQTADEFTRANLPDATSLALASVHPAGGGAPDARTAAAAVIRELDLSYTRLVAGAGVPEVEADWKRRTGLLDRQVVLERPGGGTTTGRLRDMAFDGLVLETGGGVVEVIPPESVAHIHARW